MKFASRRLLALAVTLAFTCHASASSDIWTNFSPGTFSWNNSANWSAGVPTSSSDVSFQGLGLYLTLDLGGNAYAHSFIAPRGGGSLTLQNGMLDVSSGAFQLTDFTRVTFDAGMKCATFTIGTGLSTDFCSATVTTNGWVSTNALNIGATDEENSLSISGGAVTVLGTAAVGAKGAINLSAGTLKTGTLDLGGVASRLNWTAGTLELSNSDVLIGRTSSPFNTLGSSTITIGTGRSLVLSGASKRITVGDDTVGLLTISGGGTVSSALFVIGDGTGGRGTAAVTGTNSSLTATSIFVGNSTGTVGPTNLNVTAGGSVISGTTSLRGRSVIAGTGASAFIDNATWTNSGDFYVGGDSSASTGTAVVAIQNNGTLSVAGTTKIWNSNSSLTLSSGTLSTGSLDASAGNFTFTGGNLILNGGTYTPKQAALSNPYIGPFTSVNTITSAAGSVDRPILTLQNGATATGRFVNSASDGSWVIGNAGGKGGVLVTGNGSTFSAGSAGAGIFVIGLAASGSSTVNVSDGTLTVSAGAKAVATSGWIGMDGGKGSVSVDGQGSLFQITTYGLEIGYGYYDASHPAQGSLTLTNGGHATVQAELSIGDSAHGVVTVDGSGSLLQHTGGTFAVGDAAGGEGVLAIRNGGQAKSDGIIIVGRNAGHGVVTVDGTGSLLQTTSTSSIASLAVGLFRETDGPGDGTLTVINGGQVSSANTVFVGYSDSKGVINVGKSDGTDSGGTSLVAPNLSMGVNCTTFADATATLNIYRGGTVTVSGTTSTLQAANTATINLAGGTLQTGALNLSAGGTLTWTSGTLNLTNSSLTLGTGGTLGTSLTTSATKHLRVSGTGQSLAIAAGGSLAAASLTVGAAASGIEVGASAFSQSAGTTTISGTTKINAGSTLSLSGGTLATGSLDTSSTPAGLNWSNGTLAITRSDLTLGTDSILTSVTTSPTKFLRVSSTSNFLRVNAGGALTADSLTIGGTPAATDQAFAANGYQTGGTTTITGTAKLNSGGRLDVAGGTFTAHALDATASADLYLYNTGQLIIDGGTLTTPSTNSFSFSGTLALRNGAQFNKTYTVRTIYSTTTAGDYHQDIPSANVYVGNGGAATLNVDGANSKLTVPSNVLLPRVYAGISYYTTASGILIAGNGTGAFGTINITNGGSVSTGPLIVGYAGGQGTLSVSGAASTVTATSAEIGSSRNGSSAGSVGTLALSGGAQASVNYLYVGTSGASGTATVGGAGSKISGSTLNVGVGTYGAFPSAGSLSVTNEAQVTYSSSYVGYFGGTGALSVDGANSKLATSSYLYVGSEAHDTSLTTTLASTGTLNVTGGALVSAGTLYVGNDGGTGAATVSGAGSRLTTSSVNIGTVDHQISYNGANGAITGSNGQLTVANGGTVTANTYTSLGGNVSKGTLILVSGGSYSTYGIDVNAGGKIVLQGGSLVVSNSSLPYIKFNGGELVASTTTNLLPDHLHAVRGQSTITLTASQSSATTLTSVHVANIDNTGGAFLIRGTNLGLSAPGTIGATNLINSNGPDALMGGNVGGRDIPNLSILPMAIGDYSTAGNGTDFLTYDSTKGYRLLNRNTEYRRNSLSVSSNFDNLYVSTALSGSVSQVNSILLDGGSLSLSGTTYVYAGSILAASGSNTLNPANLIEGNSNGAYITTVGDLTINGPITFNYSATPFVKNGPGTLTLSQPVFGGLNTYINNGTLKLINSANLPAGTVTIAPGATLDTSALGVLQVTDGTVLSGTGKITGSIAIKTTGRISPGHSPGNMPGDAQEWGAGGFYDWQLQSATGSAGTGYDTITLSDSILLTATPEDPFTITLNTLDADDAPGLADFDPNFSYAWVLLTAPSGIDTLDLSALALDTTNFLNDLAGGSFALSTSGDQLLLSFTTIAPPPPPEVPVAPFDAPQSIPSLPEPTTLSLLAFSAIPLLTRRASRRQ